MLLLIQAHRQVKLSKLASLFPQPIKYESRKRNLQRFLGIGKLCVKLLWFPLIKYWIRQSLTPKQLNREQRRYFQKKQYQKYGYWIVALDRTQWKGRNIFMVTLVWGTHALPLYWETLNHVGNSNLQTQKRLIKTAIKLLKKCRIVVLADREFHSPKLAKWLDEQGVYFALRQKKNLYFQEKYEQEYKVLKNQGFKPGMSKFYERVKCGKEDELGLFNIAVYWKRKYRNKGPKEPWYIGIETYAGRIQEHQDKYPRQSDFSFALYGQLWIYGMELWGDLALNLINLKPHKRLFFQRGFQALSLMKKAV